MRLMESQIVAGFDHPNLFVREQVLQHFESSRRTQVDITRHVISVIDRHGFRGGFQWPHRVAEFELNEDGMLWALDQIQRLEDDDEKRENMVGHLTRMVCQAPIELLRPHLPRILQLNAFQERQFQGSVAPPAERIEKRIEIWEQSPQVCWNLLEEHFESIGEVENFADADVPYAEMLVERIASAGHQFESEMLSVLSQEDIPQLGPRPWIVGMMIILAGRLRTEAAIPLLVRFFDRDWDWYNEEIMYSLVRIGTPGVLEYVRELYFDLPSWTRHYLSSVFENVHQDNAIDCILPLLDREDDSFFRGQLGVALASHFDDRGVEPAKELYFEDPDDRERDEITSRLFAHACLVDIELPEKDLWEKQIEEDWVEFQEKLESPRGGLNKLIRRWFDSTPQDDRWRDESWSTDDDVRIDARSDDIAPPPTTVVRDEPRIGRNDPCPCGSGKKFKKCCMRAKSS